MYIIRYNSLFLNRTNQRIFYNSSYTSKKHGSAGSACFGPPGSGSSSQRCGSSDPDPHQNVTDPPPTLVRRIKPLELYTVLNTEELFLQELNNKGDELAGPAGVTQAPPLPLRLSGRLPQGSQPAGQSHRVHLHPQVSTQISYILLAHL